MSDRLPPTRRKGQDPPAARHLKPVRPQVPREGPRPYRRRPPVFDPTEASRLRAALISARFLFGSYACAADAMYVVPEALRAAATGRAPVTAEMAVRLARALGKPLDALLRPLSDASTCSACGARRAP